MRRWDRIASTLLLFVLLSLRDSKTDARVILCDESLGKEVTSDYEDRYPFFGDIFPSVAYFDFREIRILYEVDFVMNGLLKLFSSQFLPDDDGEFTDDVTPMDPEDTQNLYHPFPKLMLGDLESDSFEDIAAAARSEEIDFVILTLDDAHYTWKEKLRWWWLRQIPGVATHKYVASANSEPPYFLAISSLDGNFLTEILLWKESAILDYGDLSAPEVQIQIDDTSLVRGMDLVVQAALYTIFICLAFRWLMKSTLVDEALAPNVKPRFTAEELGQGEICDGPSSHECAICLEAMPIGTTVRILPCRHSFHHECIVGWLNEDKHTCPMCKFDLFQHFEEQKQAKEIMLPQLSTWRQRLLQRGRTWRLNRTISTDGNQLLEAVVPGDLELTEEHPSETGNRTSIRAEDGVTV